MEPLALFIPLFIIAGVVMMIWHHARAESMVDQCAAAEQYRIISSERRTFRRGPFFFTSGRTQEVYRITVETSSGEIKSGYLRCGGMFLGLLSDRVDVRWDAHATSTEEEPGASPTASALGLYGNASQSSASGSI